MGKHHSISQDLIQEAFTDAFRAFVGRGKSWSQDAMSEETGIDLRTIGAYHEGKACPALARFMMIAAILGPEFMNRLLPMAGLADCRSQVQGKGSALELNSQLADLLKRYADGLADQNSPGRIDEQEERALLPLYTTIQAAVTQRITMLTGISRYPTQQGLAAASGDVAAMRGAGGDASPSSPPVARHPHGYVSAARMILTKDGGGVA